MFVDADRRSLSGQRLALSLRGTQLGLLVVAALLAVLPFTARGIEWGVLGAGVAFAAAFLTEATILSIQPDKTWYQCRAIAESVKSLAWRYAVGGTPFPTPSTEPGSQRAERPDRLDYYMNYYMNAIAKTTRAATMRRRETVVPIASILASEWKLHLAAAEG